MTDTRYLHHVTLNTGHSRRSYRDEVADVAIAAVQDALSRALSGPGARAALPVPGYEMTATAHGRALLATVWRGQTPLVTLGVALTSRSGAGLWRLMHEAQGLATANQPCPPEPWVAGRIEPTGASDPAALVWIADFERVAAWAWLSRHEASI